MFGARKIANKHVLTAFQSTVILYFFEKQSQFVNNKLTLTTDRVQIEEKTCEQKGSLSLTCGQSVTLQFPIRQTRFQSFYQLHHVAVVFLTNQLNELC